MRVLWFTGVQLPGVTGKELTRAGWQEGLRKALEIYEPQVELGIATFGPTECETIVQGNASYFTLPRHIPKDRISRAWNAWQHNSYTAADYDICINLVQKFAPDLVHFHGSENFFGLISAEISPPSVLSIQAIVNACFPFFFDDLGLDEIVKLLTTVTFIRGGGPIHKWLSWRKYSKTEIEILQNCQNYMGRTEWDRAVLLAFNPKANYFPCNEILADTYYSQEWHQNSADSATIYSTSSGSYFKGVLLLAKSVAILKQRGRKNICLKLAGINRKYDAGRTLVELIHRDHLEENITMFERLSSQSISEEMLHAGIFVHSSHIDNSPNSLCEAMLIGMPCIAANTGGVPSLIKDGEDGLLYHDRDPYILADKIARVLDDRALAARLGANARQIAMKRHDRQQIAGNTVDIYQQIISSRS
jgi:glycosyltransferase involved in cell wall biosynthesis